MGAGDIGVSKRVRVMAEAFMGRLEPTRVRSTAEIARHSARRYGIFFVVTSRQMTLVDFVLVLEQRIAALDTTALLAGHLD